jgi:hypothetical protein
MELLALRRVLRLRQIHLHHTSVQPVVIVGTFRCKMLGQESDFAPNRSIGDAVDCEDIFFDPSVLIGQSPLLELDLGEYFELTATAVMLVAAPSPVLFGYANNFDELSSQRLDNLAAARGSSRGGSTRQNSLGAPIDPAGSRCGGGNPGLLLEDHEFCGAWSAAPHAWAGHSAFVGGGTIATLPWDGLCGEMFGCHR